MLTNLPEGFSEFIAHPAYLDDELSRWSTYLEPRERERKILLDPRLKEGLAGRRPDPRRLSGHSPAGCEGGSWRGGCATRRPTGPSSRS